MWISLFQAYIGNVPPNPRCKTSSESKPTTSFDVVMTFFQKTTGIIARRRNWSDWSQRDWVQMAFCYQGYVQAALVIGGVDVTGPHLHTQYNQIHLLQCLYLSLIKSTNLNGYGKGWPYAIIFSDVNERSHVPVKSTLATALFAAVLAFLMDVSQLAGMVSVGTLLAFTVVAISILVLRYIPPNEIPATSLRVRLIMCLWGIIGGVMRQTKGM
ncbi:hypothetical protein K1719_025317 [Acacia pycnantha]|nr:hypothetical protein K1719_025317 [Acacia pycnantha]